MKLMAHHPSHFGKNAPMIKIITKILINSYISETAFRPLNIIEFKEGSYSKREIKIPYKWNTVKDFSLLY